MKIFFEKKNLEFLKRVAGPKFGHPAKGSESYNCAPNADLVAAV